MRSARDISDGGIAVTLAESCFGNGIGVRVSLQQAPETPSAWHLFGESATQIIVSCDPAVTKKVSDIVGKYDGLTMEIIGETLKDEFEIRLGGKSIIHDKVNGLRHVWSGSLDLMLHSDATVRS